VLELGTEKIMLVGTDLGTFEDSRRATYGDDAGITTFDDGNLETYDNGTATGDDQDDGNVTDVGT
jgi:hypothetical protein